MNKNELLYIHLTLKLFDAKPNIKKGKNKIAVRNKKTKKVVAYFEKTELRRGLAHYLYHLEDDNNAEYSFRYNFLSQAEVFIDGKWQTVRDCLCDRYENIELAIMLYGRYTIKVNFNFLFRQSYYRTNVYNETNKDVRIYDIKSDTVTAGVKKAMAFIDEQVAVANKIQEQKLAKEKELEEKREAERLEKQKRDLEEKKRIEKAKKAAEREMAERRRREQEEQQRLEREKKEAEERRLASCQEGGFLDWLAGAPKCCECNRRLRRENIVNSQYMGQRLRSEYQRGYVVKDIIVRDYECEFCGTITEKTHQRDA